MEHFLAQIIEGFATGCLYGLVGLAMMFSYRSSRVFNFAQGEMATAVVFAAFVFSKGFDPAPAVVLALGFAFVLGFLLNICVVSFVSNQSDLAKVIISIGFYAIINSFNTWKFGSEPYNFPTPFPAGGFTLASISISYQTAGTISVAALISLALFLFFRFTSVGLQLQGIAEDPLAAKLKGIRVWLMVPIAWGISSFIGGIAGMIAAHSLYLHPNTMGTLMLYSFAGAVVGGLQSSFGALVGGILVGVVENVASVIPFIGSSLKTVAVFVVLVFFLTLRPRGLFGRDEPRRI